MSYIVKQSSFECRMKNKLVYSLPTNCMIFFQLLNSSLNSQSNTALNNVKSSCMSYSFRKYFILQSASISRLSFAGKLTLANCSRMLSFGRHEPIMKQYEWFEVEFGQTYFLSSSLRYCLKMRLSLHSDMLEAYAYLPLSLTKSSLKSLKNCLKQLSSRFLQYSSFIFGSSVVIDS